MAALQYMNPPIDKISALIDNMPMGPQKLQYLQHAANGAVQEVPAWLATSKLAALNTAEQQAKAGQMGGEQPTIKDSVVQAAGLAGVQNERMQAMQQQMAQQGAQQPGPAGPNTPQPQRQPQPEGGVAGLPVGSNMFSQKSFAHGGIAHFDGGGTTKDKDADRIRAAIAELSGQPELPLNVGTPYSDAMARAQDMGQNNPDNVGIKKALALMGTPVAAAADLAVLPINFARKYVHAPGTDTSDVSLAPVMDAQRQFLREASDNVERGRPTNVAAYAPLMQQGSPASGMPTNAVAANPTDSRLAAGTQSAPQGIPRINPAVVAAAAKQRVSQVAPSGIAATGYANSPDAIASRKMLDQAVAPIPSNEQLVKDAQAMQRAAGIPEALAAQKAVADRAAADAAATGERNRGIISGKEDDLRRNGWGALLTSFGVGRGPGQIAQSVQGETTRQQDLARSLQQQHADVQTTVAAAQTAAEKAKADYEMAMRSGNVTDAQKARQEFIQASTTLRSAQMQSAASVLGHSIGADATIQAAIIHGKYQVMAANSAEKLATMSQDAALRYVGQQKMQVEKDLAAYAQKPAASIMDEDKREIARLTGNMQGLQQLENAILSGVAKSGGITLPNVNYAAPAPSTGAPSPGFGKATERK